MFSAPCPIHSQSPDSDFASLASALCSNPRAPVASSQFPESHCDRHRHSDRQDLIPAHQLPTSTGALRAVIHHLITRKEICVRFRPESPVRFCVAQLWFDLLRSRDDCNLKYLLE
ncbi:hypothetical protein HBI56_027060 [Parastagonospora nodorum]|uniref:Uncharacterized protein n=1 Tax=Phaeosphaeria nodorum (strain SN15 / ATCC MYA-4574 / FGSC 10173) TaxID=321614 RepID=A0A7U2EXQ9_PHANO|nr:hypothetical protein HBH56_014710 [Parastagonospora nodorum]QRC94959.1 hypothetical protein JI435_406600 [Parastagonospora nodorum SN15]KAH3937318.1 hypothetical protein HBH54_019730 [Parastagonospora nodorum]KAH3953683.1 hypothetical protein HBH53_032130 [Parastagonospora nodorum]KAH3969345.1 hypothetical protein HBH51_124300 [Parastagonospora nodorum]